MADVLHPSKKEALIESTSKWIDERVDRFSPWRTGELSMEGMQSLAELGVLVFRILQAADQGAPVSASVTERAQNWKRHLINQICDPAFAELARKRPVQSFPYVLPYLTLRMLGYRNSFHEKTLIILRQYGFPFTQEVVPYRELDAAYFSRRSGLEVEADLGEIYLRTFLGRHKSAVHVDNESAYAITHAVFYLSDFGLKPLCIPERDIATIRNTIESLTIHYWRVGHWDLLGELLLCTTIIGPTKDSPFAFAFDAMLSFQRRDGSFPGRRETVPAIQEAELKNDSNEVFSACYHTTVVALLLAVQVERNSQ